MPWLGTAARVLLGGVFVAAGVPKAIDPQEAVLAVTAHRILPPGIERTVGIGLPFVEIAIGLLLFLGVATRAAAAVSAGLLVMFSVGISAAWLRGMSIDCGCFGEGGATSDPDYATVLLRNAALLGVAFVLMRVNRTRFALDSAGGSSGTRRASDGSGIDAARPPGGGG